MTPVLLAAALAFAADPADWVSMEIRVRATQRPTGWTLSAPDELLQGLAFANRQFGRPDLERAFPEAKPPKHCGYRLNLDSYVKPKARRRDGSAVDVFIAWYFHETVDGWGSQASLETFMRGKGPVPKLPKNFSVIKDKKQEAGRWTTRLFERSAEAGNMLHAYSLDTGSHYVMLQFSTSYTRKEPVACLKPYIKSLEAIVASLAPKDAD